MTCIYCGCYVEKQKRTCCYQCSFDSFQRSRSQSTYDVRAYLRGKGLTQEEIVAWLQHSSYRNSSQR